MTLAACGKGAEAPQKGANAAAGQPLLIAAEDVHTIRNSALTSGPVITGSVQPERRADLRAEVSAIVLQVLKENGDTVRRGDLLVRLDDTAIRDGLASAESASRAAAQAFEQAERQFQRMTTLRASGMASAQQVEDAEIRRNNAQSDLEGAKTRVVLARQQLAAHRGARALRRHRERPQGLGRRYRADRQGTGQGDRSGAACASRAWCRPTTSAP